ncbi:DUF1294 domain-containing protein [Rhizophagus clarus]|uniref:DUF1294 domain-containing protein n=1 Tax=Rhizophagus clarus TaxID=94130 RepID=A0A8H3QJV1_9GLOM|nr:DUF1294 domain-containing protein [Rhizophagus clarus]
MARTNILPTFRVILTCWLGFQVLKATTLLHFIGKRHGYYDSKVAFVIGVQTIAPPIVVINVVTWFVFWFDKQQSKLHNWRTPERELLWWLWTTGVFGGWLSMFVCRHKIRKQKIPPFYVIPIRPMRHVWLIPIVPIGNTYFCSTSHTHRFILSQLCHMINFNLPNANCYHIKKGVIGTKIPDEISKF